MNEAFCYVITDSVTNKLYVGWHFGQPTDGYLCSSKILLKEYNVRPETFTRQIIATGTKEDMFKLETALLVSINAMEDPQFYNKSNNFGRNCSNPTKNTTWWNNGKIEKRNFISPGPEWKNGRLNCVIGGAARFGSHSDEAKLKMSNHAKTRLGKRSACYGKICINNGVINKKIDKSDGIPHGWFRGMITKRRINHGNQ